MISGLDDLSREAFSSKQIYAERVKEQCKLQH
jgi:hypothetical protein